MTRGGTEGGGGGFYSGGDRGGGDYESKEGYGSKN